jgi:hypothetical protein
MYVEESKKEKEMDEVFFESTSLKTPMRIEILWDKF